MRTQADLLFDIEAYSLHAFSISLNEKVEQICKKSLRSREPGGNFRREFEIGRELVT